MAFEVWCTKIIVQIQNQPLPYILVMTTILAFFAIKQQFSKTHKMVIVFIILGTVAAVGIPIYFPFLGETGKVVSSSSETESVGESEDSCGGESLVEYRYNLYDDAEIKARVDAINNDLSSKGMYINPDKLKAFIYAMNGDYSLCNSGDILNDVSTVLMNANIDFISILRSGFDIKQNYSVTTFSSLADIFRDPKDYEMVLFWQTKYNQIHSEIYTQGPTEKSIYDLDEYCISLYETFLFFEPVIIDEETVSSVYNISDEAEFVILTCMNSLMSYAISSPDGGTRDGNILFEREDGEVIYMEIHTMSEGLERICSNAFSELLSRHGFC